MPTYPMDGSTAELGIITAIEFDSLPGLEVSKGMDVYTSFEIGFDNPTIERAEQLLLGWQEFILDAANIGDPIFERLTLEPWLRYDLGGPELSLACHFYGNDDLHADLIARFLPKILNLLDGGYLSEVRRYDHLNMHRRLGGVDNNAELASGRHGWDLYENNAQRNPNHWKGYSAAASKRVSGKAFRKLAEAIFDSEPRSQRYVEFKQLQGAIKKSHNQTDEMAFWHRDAIWWILNR